MEKVAHNEVYYNPESGVMMYAVDGKPLHGFAGPIGERKFAEACGRGDQIVFTDPKRSRIKRFYALLSKLGIMAQKENILAGYGVEHTTDLTVEELDEVIARFTSPPPLHPPQPLQKGGDPQRGETAHARDAVLRKLRSQCLTVLQQMGVYSTNDDWSRVNEYLMQPKISGKLLFQMTEEELKSLHRKLCSIRDKEVVKQEEEAVMWAGLKKVAQWN